MEASADKALPIERRGDRPPPPAAPQALPLADAEAPAGLSERLGQICGNPLLEGLREAQAAHQAIIREIERAREVVTFSLETAAAGHGYEIAGEGVENALLLTTHQRQTALDLHPVVERRLAEVIAVAI